MSLKSIGTVSTILKDIAISGNVTKASFDALNLSLQGMTESQIAAALSLSGLSAEQIASSLASSGFTAAETAAALATMHFSEEATVAALTTAGFEKAQIEGAVAATTFTVAETAATTATGGLSAAIAGLGTVIAANPIGAIITAITVIIALIPIAINLFNKFHKSTEELKQEYDDLASELDGLNSELKTTKDRIAELQKLSDEGKITLVEQEELNKLLETNVQLERQIRLREEAAKKAGEEANKSLVKDYDKQSYSSISGTSKMLDASALYEQHEDDIKLYQEMANGWLENWDKLAEDEKNRIIELYNEYDRLIREGNNEQMYPFPKDTDEYIQELIDRYKELDSLGDDITDVQKGQMEEIRSELVDLGDMLQTDFIDNFVGDGETLDNWNALADAIDACINPAEHFTSLLNSLPTDLKDALSSEGTNGELTAERVNELAGQYQELADWMEKSGYTADEVASHYNALKVETDSNADSTGRYSAQLSDLTDVLSDLQSAYDVLTTAQEEMAGGGGLSADTIADLAEAEANYLDYLYEENGVVKLNTDAWKENANAKMQSEMDEIQKEIDSLEEENRVLQENISYYEEQRQLGNDGGIWNNLIVEATEDIKENTDAIAGNQARLALYSSLYGSITGDMDAYTSALNNFTNIANTIDSVSGSFQTLADLQAQVANGFTMSLDKALEFAAVYPEILNSAQVTADGQISLNESVVNSFIEGKKAELDAQVDTEIAKLEADKAVLTAKMDFAEAELELAKSVADGEGDITKELAEYRINAGNAVAQALIDAGIDEATAFKLAAAAMAQNAEEFDRVAMEVCTDVNGNFNQAAYDLAQTMYKNLTNVKTDLASVAKQAHETAKAIAGIANGDSSAGSAGIQGGSGGGTGGSGIKLNLTSGSFNGTEYTYTAKESGLEDFISQIELDISDYQNAIAQIDGQIATLQALKNLPLKSFKSSSGSGGSGSGSSDSAAKEIEEYIATIDDYREAIEKLNRIQIKRTDLETQLSNTGDLRTQIKLQEQLIGVYKEEQDALHEVNELRDQTIKNGTESLKQLGFDVEYDPDNNLFFVKNLEHLNELIADSKGEYDTIQEATNALRQDTEDLIGTLGDLNEANQENSESWRELAQAAHEARIAIYENTVKEHENSITLDENLLEDAIKNSDFGGVTRYTADIISQYRAMQDAIHEEAEYYRSLGYADTSDEVSKLSDLWWDYYDEIAETSANAWQQVVDNANDAVNEITGVFSTLKDAAKEFAENGHITVESLQEICSWGLQYLAYLSDENGQLVINESSIQKVIAARTEQMAVETALSYVAQIRSAIERNEIDELMNLTLATEATTSATWDLVYAQLRLMNLSGELNDTMYAGALQNVNNLRSLTANVVDNVDQMYTCTEEIEEDTSAITDALREQKELLEDQADALDDLLKYVKEMIKQEVKNQIKALEDQVSAYKKIVNLQKESLKLEREKDDYNKNVKNKINDIAELQKRIAMLDLDGSREAMAEKAELQEELAELQEDLADTQADHAYDATCDMLDDMADAYEEEKNKEIEILEESISSEEKLYRLAIERIQTQWDTLYQQLIDWNYEYGTVTNDEITSVWQSASAAVEKYGSYLDAVLATTREIAALEAQIEAYQSTRSSQSSSSSSSNSSTSTSSRPSTPSTSQTNNVVGNSGNYDTSGDATISQVRSIVHQMKANSEAHHTADTEGKARLNKANLELGKQFTSITGRTAVRGDDGVWYLDRVGGPKLYETYPYSTYHTGGIVGDDSTLKQDEVFAKLKKGEAVLTDDQQQAIYKAVDFADTMINQFGGLFAKINATDMMNMRMRDNFSKDSQQIQNIVQTSSGNTFDINVPVEIRTVQKLDETEIKKLTKDISKYTITEINDSLAKKGLNSIKNPLRP